MPDWKSEIRSQLAKMNLETARESEIVDEVSQHFDDQYQDLLAQGISDAEAQRLILDEVQNKFELSQELQQIERHKKQEQKIITLSKGMSMHEVYQDIRYALRMLYRSPGFTALAALTLSLGIGLNTSMFSVLNAMLLRPPPFPNPEHLAVLYRSTQHNAKGGFAPADYLDLEREEAGFGRLAGYFFSSIAFSEPGKPAEWQNSLRVSADFFDILDVHPRLGRNFRPEEEIYGNHHVVLLSYTFWQERFGGDTNIVGRIIHCNGEPSTIIGVLPASAHERRLFGNARLFRPLGFSPAEGSRRDIAFMNILGRRSSTTSLPQSDAFVESFGARMASAFPAVNGGSTWRAEGLHASITKPNDRVIGLLLVGLSGLVLLIACSNLANLLLARAIGRAREFAVRAALGASRMQVLRPLLAESTVLAALSGIGALFVAAWVSNWLRSLILDGGGPPFDLGMDWRVLSYAFAAAVLTLLFFGIAPALFTIRVNASETLKSSARGATSGPGHKRLRQALVVGQFTLAMVLMAGAGFFIRGTMNLLNQHHGWESDHVVQGTIDLPNNKYSSDAQNLAFHRNAIERLSQLPGVKAASISYALPYRGLNNSERFIIEGQEAVPERPGFDAMKNGISSSYFEVTGTRLLMGRTFNDADDAKAPKVVIINETMAKTLFHSENPLGRRIAHAGSNPPQWAEIVGVAADVRSVAVNKKPLKFQVYEPIAQDIWYYGEGKPVPLSLAVRTAGVAPKTIMDSVRKAIMDIDPDLPIRNLMLADQLVTQTISEIDTFKTLFSWFAMIGLFLAALGIYGVISRTVAQRTGEIGIRMALGAQAMDVIRLIVGSGLRLAAIGAVLGLLGSYGLSRLIAIALPSMQINSGMVIASGAVLLIFVALFACFFPARRASKIEPGTALRTD